MWTDAEASAIRAQAAALGSDGCSGPSEVFHLCCLAHDIAYRTTRDFTGQPVTRRAADRAFRACMIGRSRLGWLSPVAWGRWALVRIFARGAW